MNRVRSREPNFQAVSRTHSDSHYERLHFVQHVKNEGFFAEKQKKCIFG